MDVGRSLRRRYVDSLFLYLNSMLSAELIPLLHWIGIFTRDGAEWKFQRKLASHIFTVKAFREYTSDVFVIEGKKVLNYLGKAADEGTVVDFQALMLHFTLDSFGAYVPSC